VTVSTKDNLAQVVLYTNLGYDPNDEKAKIKPFTTAAYNKIEEKLAQAKLRPEIFLTEKLDIVSRLLSLTEEQTERINKLLLRSDRLGEEIERLAEDKIYITTRTSENYPTKLKIKMDKNTPVVLYYSGEMRLIEMDTVAVIGSREATEQESEYAKKHAMISAQNNITVVSGGAMERLKRKLTKLYVKDDKFATVGNKKLIEMGGLPLNEEHERLV
jgi:predicted Rossmann fold nucleotide-binding protein DprA/Smf involved in DNA uptake